MEAIIFSEPKVMNNPTEIYTEITLDTSEHTYQLDTNN
jgi:hypothetical protein